MKVLREAAYLVFIYVNFCGNRCWSSLILPTSLTYCGTWVIQPILSFLCQLLWVLSSIIFHFSYLHIYCGACVRLSCLNLCQLLSLSQRRLETAKGGKLAPNLQSLAKTLRKWWMGLFQGHVHTYIDFCETFKNFNIFRFPLQSAFVTSEKWHQAPHNSLVSNLLANSAWLRIKAFA